MMGERIGIVRPRRTTELLTFFLWSICVPGPLAAASVDVPYSFALRSRSITLNEPVVVELTIENTVKQNVHFQLGFNEKANFRFTIIDPNGTQVQPHAPAEAG